jgi:glycosyltransferase involved in cell wall biosynthesis
MPNKKVIFSHPTGNANVRAALNGLSEAGILARFFTSIACFPDNTYDKLSRISGFSEFKKREFDSRLQSITKTKPFKELTRLAAMKAGVRSLVKHETGMFSIDAVYTSMDRYVAKQIKNANPENISAVYAYEDGAKLSFEASKMRGLKCLYDLPIGYWRAARKLLSEERENRPEWASTLMGFMDSDAKLAKKDEELRLADHIFVASSFTAATLKEYPSQLAPISIIPYGFPQTNPGKAYDLDKNRPLRVLFVGGLSQRKGIANVFEAVEGFGKHVELTVVGHKLNDDCVALNKALAKHKWIPSLPHSGILQLMREQDVLVFPSLFEGFGLVITEAMSQGTPVITTERTAGPDLIQHGKNGWLIEAGSTEAIKTVIDQLMMDKSAIEAAGLAAIDTAAKRPWTSYGRELSAVITKTIS